MFGDGLLGNSFCSLCREGGGLRRSSNYGGYFILSFICFTLIISSSLSAPSEIIHYHLLLPAGRRWGNQGRSRCSGFWWGGHLMNLAWSWQAVIPSVDLTQSPSLLHCRGLGSQQANCHPRASVCCWARRHRATGDHKTGGKQIRVQPHLSPFTGTHISHLLLLACLFLKGGCDAVEIIRQDICTICMVIIMAGVKNDNSYAYPSSIECQSLASLRCQVTASLICFPFFPLQGSWATLSPACMDCILGPSKLVSDQPWLKNITSLLWGHHTAYVGGIKGTTVVVKEEHWAVHNKTFLLKSHDHLNRGLLKELGSLFLTLELSSWFLFLDKMLYVMSLIQSSWVHGM